MLEVRPENYAFVIVDTDTGQAVMRFDNRREADQLIAELQVRDLHETLVGWSQSQVDLTASEAPSR